MKQALVNAKTKRSLVLEHNYVFIFLLILFYNIVIRIPFLFKIFYLNEDSALIIGASNAYNWKHPGTLLQHFYTPYGPNVIRPFELLGLYFENAIFGFTPQSSLVVGVFLFSLGLSFLWKAISYQINIFGVFACCILLSTSVATSEPLLWLSDRHDVYLFVFGSLSLLICARQRILHSNIAITATLLTLFLWGGFLSNEKGTALPLMLSGAILVFNLADSDVVNKQKLEESLGLILICLLNFIAYFLFRFFVLGMLVGGYDNKVLPDLFGFADILKFIFRALTTTIFLQESQSGFEFILVSLVILLLGYLVLINVRLDIAKDKLNTCVRFKPIAIIFLLVLICISSAIPTLRAFLWEGKENFGITHIGVLNVRNFWLNHITMSIILGVIYGYLFSRVGSKFSKILIIGLISLQIGVGLAQTRRAGEHFVEASNYTKNAMAVVSNICSCIDTKWSKGQGLIPLYAGVNSFTEPNWLHAHLLLNGFPKCVEEEQACNYLVMNSEAGEVSAINVNLSNDLIQKLTSIFDSTGYTSAKYHVYDINYYLESKNISKNVAKKVLIGNFTGWAYQNEDMLPINALAIIVNGKPIKFTKPNIARLDIPPGQKKISNYGFDIDFEYQIEEGVNYNIKLVALSVKGEKVVTTILFSF